MCNRSEFEKVMAEIRVCSQESTGSLTPSCFSWVLFGHPIKELTNSLLVGKTTHGLRVNLCGPTIAKNVNFKSTDVPSLGYKPLDKEYDSD